MLNDRALANFYPINLSMIDTNPGIDCLGDLDSQAVTSVYNHYFPQIFRYVKYRLGDESLAEDISSEVFLSLLKALKNGNGPGKNLRGWLIGAARHMVVDHIRHKYRHPSQAISDALVSGEAGPCEQVEQRDASYSLRMALVQLTEDQQQVLTLRFGQGYSLEETAEIMKKRINAIKALQFRALNALQRRIGEES
jgi:RNA polymerase sigma-70 factor (ECF subfamily)